MDTFWVVTQDGLRCLQVIDFFLQNRADYGYFDIVANNLSEPVLLGSYDTEKRAKSVMSDICMKIASTDVLKVIYVMPKE